MTIPTITDDLIAEIEAEFQNAYDKGLTAYVDPKDGLALTAHIRQLEKDAALKDARIAELETEVDGLHYKVCEAMQAAQ